MEGIPVYPQARSTKAAVERVFDLMAALNGADLSDHRNGHQNRFEPIHSEFGGNVGYQKAKLGATRANCPGPAGDVVVEKPMRR